MARTTGNNVNDALTGSVGEVSYDINDLLWVLGQSSVTGLSTKNIILRIDLEGVSPRNVTAMVGVNGSMVLDGDTDWFALPCPPYCGKE